MLIDDTESNLNKFHLHKEKNLSSLFYILNNFNLSFPFVRQYLTDLLNSPPNESYPA